MGTPKKQWQDSMDSNGFNGFKWIQMDSNGFKWIQMDQTLKIL